MAQLNSTETVSPQLYDIEKLVLAHAWATLKAGKSDNRSQIRCSGGMPSDCYSNKDFDDTLDAYIDAANTHWRQLSPTTRVFVYKDL